MSGRRPIALGALGLGLAAVLTLKPPVDLQAVMAARKQAEAEAEPPPVEAEAEAPPVAAEAEALQEPSEDEGESEAET